jgi:hypothetical protein
MAAFFLAMDACLVATTREESGQRGQRREQGGEGSGEVTTREEREQRSKQEGEESGESGDESGELNTTTTPTTTTTTASNSSSNSIRIEAERVEQERAVEWKLREAWRSLDTRLRASTNNGVCVSFADGDARNMYVRKRISIRAGYLAHSLCVDSLTHMDGVRRRILHQASFTVNLLNPA